MNKAVYESLILDAHNVAKAFSNPNREYNHNQENFLVDGITVLSETVAAVTFKKSSGLKALAVFYYTRNGSGTWQHFFPTDSHILGLCTGQLVNIKQKIELINQEARIL